MTPGNYAVVVDVDMNKKVSNGDLVDIVDKKGDLRTVRIGTTDYPSGFSVINR